MRYVALLRGINVGASTAMAMPDLRAVVERLGHSEVRTHLRSGNVVFTSADERPDRVASLIERGIAEDLGLTVSVIVRTAAELRRIVEENPLAVPDPTRFTVMFLSGPPDRAALEGIDPAAYAPEEMRIGARELYLHFPEGMRRTRLDPLLAKRLSGTWTTRNWNTVTRLLALAEG
ncbi:DUF1697 domain-containing protein [Microtetraspora niveoalba]|uniref:DUF1697 domain-containing protein n=1 Tax=Microtetraspora niveoalba TaxID=46175 RepID=UPI000832B2DD|nr:DUF1697 domain-containing protein [Microtetraspora niveoalba]